MSVRLSKHFNYEVSLNNYHYKVLGKTKFSYQDSSVNYSSNVTFIQKKYLNFLGIGNGLSYHYKRFNFTKLL